MAGIIDTSVPDEIIQLRERVEEAEQALTRRCWQLAAVVPCSCGGHTDGWHSKHCDRRVRAEILEGIIAL